jgi:hypothetical protein
VAVIFVVIASTVVSALFPSASMVWPGSQGLSAGVAVNAAVNVHNRGSSDYSDYRVSAGHSHGPPTVVNVQFRHEQTYYVLAGSTPVLVHNTGPGCGTNLPNLHGQSLADAEAVLGNSGFRFVNETAGGYRKYTHADGSEVWIRPNGEVIRLGPKVDRGPNTPNYRDRYGPDGQITDLHSTGEIVTR